MSRVKAFALAIAVSLALAGCAQLFEFNLFAGLDNPPTPSAADYTGAGGLDALGEDLNSPATVAALAAEPAVVQQILDDLEANYWGDGVIGDDDSQAAILYADLALKTTEGEELVNNVVGALMDGSLTSSSDIATLLASIIPPAALADEATFTAMVEALLEARGRVLDLEPIELVRPDARNSPAPVLSILDQVPFEHRVVDFPVRPVLNQDPHGVCVRRPDPKEAAVRSEPGSNTFVQVHRRVPHF